MMRPSIQHGKEPKDKGVLEEGNKVKRQPYKGIQGYTNTTHPISEYVVKCDECLQWRKVRREEYETIRENFTKDGWHCSKRPGCSCGDPGDIKYDSDDSSRIWAIDRPDIPKAPPGTKRQVLLRSDLSRMDTYYVMPTGKRIKGPSEVDKFLKENPHCKDRMSPSDFNFATPKVIEKTVSAWKAAMVKKQDKTLGPSAGPK